MCGIVGVVYYPQENKEKEPFIKLALQQLNKRGPDYATYKSTNTGFLGHARLSIIDTSAEANQPMQDESGRYTIIFNGEIYNFQSIRDRLSAKGIQFRTHSDTEVLLKLFIEKKEKALEELDGFFSFCIYDKQEDEYFIARDRFGIKPLLYYQDNEQFIFASEMKAILQFPIDKNIDNHSLTQYFQFNYIPEPNSIFRKVKKLLPSHFIRLKNNKLEIKKYYSYYINQTPSTDTYEQAQKRIRELLFQSVEKRMIADVPVGSFLSGGIDSSIVATIGAKLNPNLHTFSIGFKDEPFFDETKYAELVAKKINTKHTVFSLSNNDLFQHFEQVLDYIDEPFADSSTINVYILSKQTRKQVTVALSGDGADELFSGYNKHKALYLADQKNIKNILIKSGSPFYKLLPKSRQNKWGNIARQLDKYATGLKLTRNERYINWASFMKREQAERLVNSSSSSGRYTLPIEIKNINDVLYCDFNLVLTNDMLKKVDSMSMANSLEVRTPFLQHELVEYVFSLPEQYKIDSKNTKKILKDAFRIDLPEELYNRSKHGFEIPLLKWFKYELKDYLEQNVFNQSLIEEQGYLNWSEVLQIKKQLHSSNPNDAVSATWALIVFQHWVKKYL